ncbi:ROK family protein [Candidatus Clostridium stratigraminis]|uniref:ROK family protein n=1 Tax=Candidatus Clostridium stratigraminis TaxID=3381661 RepID=A0ABW8T4Z1_9CLOT
MSKLSGRPNILKKVNNDIIKNALKTMGSATKAELAKETGISLTTVGLILSALISEDEVLNQGFDESSGGRRAERYTLNLNHSLAAVLCVEDKYIDYAIGNTAGDLIEDDRYQIVQGKHMEAVEALIRILIKKYNSIKYIGLGVPSAVDNGRLFTGSKLKEWYSFNVKEYLETKYKLPIIIENDLNAIATGFAYNRLKEAGLYDSESLNMVYINFTEDGTGAGIIANGKLVRGFSHYAGEVGFLKLSNGRTLDNIVNESNTIEEYVSVIAATISVINCIINPEYIVIGGENFKFEYLHMINEYCSNYIDENIRPEIIPAEDSRMDYISGIMHLTIEDMTSGIRLIKSKKL